jgi:hypothetical protein
VWILEVKFLQKVIPSHLGSVILEYMAETNLVFGSVMLLTAPTVLGIYRSGVVVKEVDYYSHGCSTGSSAGNRRYHLQSRRRRPNSATAGKTPLNFTTVGKVVVLIVKALQGWHRDGAKKNVEI